MDEVTESITGAIYSLESILDIGVIHELESGIHQPEFIMFDLRSKIRGIKYNALFPTRVSVLRLNF